MPAPSGSAPAGSPVLLVLGAGGHHYFTYALQQVASLHPVVLVSSTTPDWARPHLVDEILVDLADSQAVATAVKEYAAEHNVIGALTYMAHHAELTARLAQDLGLPGNAPGAVAACQDNALTRRMLAEHAVPSVVNEEYLDGPEISVEAVVLGPGNIRIIAVARKRLGPGPAFEEVGHCVDANDLLLREPAIGDVITRALEALGITLGAIHAKMWLTDSGPRLIEVDAALGGDLVPLLVQLATGISLVRVAAALATGAAPDLTPSRSVAAAIGILYPNASGRVEELNLSSPDEPWLETFEPWLERLVWTQQIGNWVSAPAASSIADRVAHWVVTGKDTATCDERLLRTADSIVARIAAAPHTATCAR
ncbi:ATP-grasp domain-containing protein (plasmid) [Streptomyces sp. NBC_01724]|uniref:ATP-grasp domain-containing protein n=1 Tax=Streptomyces sp. NBC_01724 TaxID=2975922 RepID=UPI002E2F423C|nr:ATP-grasp domain-containing protein [Streptomyces sp. NBC_01724]